jgi:molybdopterin molybdotransferase
MSSPIASKPSMARPPLLSFETALAALLSEAVMPTTAAEWVPTMDALGRVLATNQQSTIMVPPVDNSSMDGYAVQRASLSLTRSMSITQRIPAGSFPVDLLPGTVARIFTGAPTPPGADAIVMQEQVELVSEGLVRFSAMPEANAWIRKAGDDIQVGATILHAGAVLKPPALGLAASVGLAQLPVRPRVRVACFFTGDELAMPGDVLKPGGIYNSNRFVLVNLLRELGCDVRDLGIVPDTLDETRAALRDAAQSADLILTSGGVSVGEEDHIKPAVEAEGSLSLWQIAIKPGKPLAYGKVVRKDQDSQVHFIGLPGNPVSSYVTFLLFVRPFILRLQGVHAAMLASIPMRADFSWPKADKRREFLRVRLNDSGGLDLFPNQSSGVQSAKPNHRPWRNRPIY